MGIVITTQANRIPITKQSADKLFKHFSETDLTNTVKKTLDGSVINMLNEKNHIPGTQQVTVMQLMPTLRCNHNCKFCIEDATARLHKKQVSPDEYSTYIDKLIDELNEQGVVPSVTITGGEPLLHFNRIEKVLEKLKKHRTINYGINTNGSFLRNAKYTKLLNEHFDTGKFHVNISRHHYDDEKNIVLFNGGYPPPLTTEELCEINEKLGGRLNLQLVLNQNAINSLDEIKKYLNKFTNLGFKRITIRSMVTQDSVVNVCADKKHYCSEAEIDMPDILDKISKDNNFEFVKQDIQAFFDDEYYKYNGSLIKFVYTNMKYSEEVERKSLEAGKQLTGIIAVMPDKALYGSWNYKYSALNSAAAIEAYSKCK